jgi:hypothetical protein
MLWYKSWLETRWRFLIGLGLLMILAAGTVFDYPSVASLIPRVRQPESTGLIGGALNEALELERSYRGFIWLQWFRQNLRQCWTLFAVLLGTGGLLATGTGGMLFTLSLPVSRRQLIGVRTGTGLAELSALALVPSLLIPLLSPAIGQSYSLGDAIVYDMCLLVGGATVFSLAVLLSTIFSDFWRPLVIALAVTFVVAACEAVLGSSMRYSVFHTMSAETYFRNGELPWIGLTIAAGLTTLMLFAAVSNITSRDF